MSEAATPSATVAVHSEIGTLRRVICHTPGPELGIVTPGNRREFLFDDLLDLEGARREHARFRTVLERFAEVLEVSDLLAEVLADEAARRFMLGRADAAFREWAAGMEAEELARLFVEGRGVEEDRPAGESLAALLNESGYSLPPLPNLLYTRDAAAVVGERVVVAAMRHEVRWTEELLMRALFARHPLLGNRGVLYDGTEERRMHTSLEGGDIHVLREDLLLLGLSERTTAAGVDAITRRLFQDTPVTDVLVVILPPHRSSIHLDMIFTVIDRGLCCVYPPYFVGFTRLPVLHVSSGKDSVREMPNLFTALAAVDSALEPIFCGGERRTDQEREQWGSGCNLFAVGPGRLLAYDRNERTLQALEEEGGFRILRAVDFLTGDATVEEDERFVVTIPGQELPRGGGGPRCMTLPVLREELA